MDFSTLTDRELLAHIFGDSIASKLKGFTLRELTAISDSDLFALNLTEAQRNKLRSIAALAGRMKAEEPKKGRTMGSSFEVANYLKNKLENLIVEEFHVMYLNRGNRVIATEKISSGGFTGTVADPRLIMRKALQYCACSMILCHNHPSGNLTPSRADEELTMKIKEAATFFDLKVLDHVIVSTDGYYSFADEGLL
jgi:DNA repair protein RadC